MALGGSPFGSFVEGLFAGAKSMTDLQKSRNELELQQMQLAAGRRMIDQANNPTPEPDVSRTPGTGAPPTTTTPESSGSSTPPAEFKPPEGVEISDEFKAHAPLIKQYENAKGDPYLGTGGADLSKGEFDPETGFPSATTWKGVPTNLKDSKGNTLYSSAAGLFQITRETWNDIAPKLGIHDFSPASQWRVADALYQQRGLQPWTVGNAPFAAAVRGGAAGGGYASMTGGGLPSTRLIPPSALGSDYTPPRTLPSVPIPPAIANTLGNYREGGIPIMAHPSGGPGSTSSLARVNADRAASGLPPMTPAGYARAYGSPTAPATTAGSGGGQGPQSALDLGAGGMDVTPDDRAAMTNRPPTIGDTQAPASPDPYQSPVDVTGDYTVDNLRRRGFLNGQAVYRQTVPF